MTDTTDRITEAFGDAGSPSEITRARRWFEHLVGPFEYSAPASALRLIDVRNLHAPKSPSGVDFKVSAFSIPAHVWSRPLTDEERSAAFVQLVDRRGSYLAAWQGCELPDGEWRMRPDTNSIFEVGAAVKVRPGYYLIDTRVLSNYLKHIGTYDPFGRHPSSEGPQWFTAPLASLALDIAIECSTSLNFREVRPCEYVIRPLDSLASRLSVALKTLDASSDPIAPVVRAQVKDAYVRGTAWFEYGPKPGHPLHRPEWRHTILDRAVANTWRSLRKAKVRPFAVGAIDSALFAAGVGDNYTTPPASLKNGTDLGSWRAKSWLPMPSGDFSPSDLMRSMIAGRNNDAQP